MPADHENQTELRLWERRREVAKLYLAGLSQSDIAEQVGVSQPTISRDIEEIETAWLNSSLMDFDEARKRELGRIDVLEQEYWQGWLDSKKPRTLTVTERVAFGKELRESDPSDPKKTKRAAGSLTDTTRSEKERQPTGDVRFLKGVEWCIAQRCKILGLDRADGGGADWRDEAEKRGMDAGSIFEAAIAGIAAARKSGPPASS